MDIEVGTALLRGRYRVFGEPTASSGEATSWKARDDDGPAPTQDVGLRRRRARQGAPGTVGRRAAHALQAWQHAGCQRRARRPQGRRTRPRRRLLRHGHRSARLRPRRSRAVEALYASLAAADYAPTPSTLTQAVNSHRKAGLRREHRVRRHGSAPRHIRRSARAPRPRPDGGHGAGRDPTVLLARLRRLPIWCVPPFGIRTCADSAG